MPGHREARQLVVLLELGKDEHVGATSIARRWLRARGSQPGSGGTAHGAIFWRILLSEFCISLSCLWLVLFLCIVHFMRALKQICCLCVWVGSLTPMSHQNTRVDGNTLP